MGKEVRSYYSFRKIKKRTMDWRKTIATVLLMVSVTSCQTSREVSEKKVDSAATQADSIPEVSPNPPGRNFVERYPLTSWLRQNPGEIGCIFEKEFNIRDNVFNCSLQNYVNKGDPCKNTESYYEGVQFPATKVREVHPLASEIILSFEGGRLRQIDINFQQPVNIEELKTELKLPIDNSSLPSNVMTIVYAHGAEKETRIISLIGFEHQGSGDVDCE
jgi:hypothetical protein